MRDFVDLTLRGQAQRLRTLALAALAHYRIEVRCISLVTNHLNGIFRVNTADGERYALPISHPTWRTDEDLRAELLWLQAIARAFDVAHKTRYDSFHHLKRRDGSFAADRRRAQGR